MMINILGPSAVGKTTFLRSIMDEIPEATTRNPVVVFGDTGDEYHYEADSDSWIHMKKHDKWAGTKEQKDPAKNLYCMMKSEKIYVVDVMRYYNGLWSYVLEAHAKLRGGTAFIVPYYTGEVGLQFRLQRCERNGKAISPYWMDVRNCWSESAGRLNMCKKRFQPAGIPCAYVEMDLARKNFDLVKKILFKWLKKEDWYEGSSN